MGGIFELRNIFGDLSVIEILFFRYESQVPPRSKQETEKKLEQTLWRGGIAPNPRVAERGDFYSRGCNCATSCRPNDFHLLESGRARINTMHGKSFTV